MGLREDIQALVAEIGSGSFTAGSAHVARELRVILKRYPEPKPKPEARQPHPLTQIGKRQGRQGE